MSELEQHDSERMPLIDRRLARAFVHPLRVDILEILMRRVASPSEIANELGERLGNVAYHVRTLLELDCIELVREEPRRGAVEHYYRAVARPFISDSDLGELPLPARQSLFDAFLRPIVRDLNDAVTSGSLLERDDIHISHSRLVLDEEGWKELRDMLAEMLARIPDIETRSASRLVDQAEDSMLVRCTLMQFLAPKPEDAAEGERTASE